VVSVVFAQWQLQAIAINFIDIRTPKPPKTDVHKPKASTTLPFSIKKTANEDFPLPDSPCNNYKFPQVRNRYINKVFKIVKP
jgi:hypothetical protein